MSPDSRDVQHLLLYAAVLAAAGILVAVGCNRSDTPRSAAELPARFEADLKPMSRKQAAGSAKITKSDSTLEVRMDVRGLLPDTTYAPNLMNASCAATGTSAGGLHSGPAPRTDANGRLAYTDTLTLTPSPMNRLTVAVWGPEDQLATCGPLGLIQE